MKYLLIPLIFITSTNYASIQDVRENIILSAYWAEQNAHRYFIDGDKAASQYYVGKVSAYHDCLELIEKDMQFSNAIDYERCDSDIELAQYIIDQSN